MESVLRNWHGDYVGPPELVWEPNRLGGYGYKRSPFMRERFFVDDEGCSIDETNCLAFGYVLKTHSNVDVDFLQVLHVFSFKTFVGGPHLGIEAAFRVARYRLE